ncbi:MAG: phosphate uptake regulator PhoU [Desulfurococcales archaeon]|nr:phosphate uptake regulator PhoU [Desulfurococcales archaeon]
METSIRKVIRIGEKSYGLTLPKEWLDRLGIKIGSSVETVIAGDHITIRPVAGEILGRSIYLEEGDENMLSKLIIASYIEGKDLIVMKGDKNVIRKAFNIVKGKLPGMIFVEKGDSPEIRITADERTINIQEVIKTMKSTAQVMFELMAKYLEDNDQEHLKEILVLDDELDSLHFIGLRSIKRMSAKMPEEAIDLAIALKALEHIGDALDRASTYLLRAKLSGRCSETLKEALRIAYRYFQISFDALISNNYRLSLEALNERQSNIDAVLDLSKKSTCFEELSAVIHEILVIIASSAEASEISISRYIRGRVRSY